MATPEGPSVLQSPRFFDEACHSEWRVDDSAGTLPKERVDAKPLATGPREQKWRPPANETDPIGIELVKGVHGPLDNSWSVIVDGLQSTAQPDASGVVTCMLPPPVPADKQVTAQSQNRGLVVAVRLEDEARRPERIQLVLEQVCTSDERANYGEDDEVIEISRVDMDAYRPCDAYAPAAVMPYPYRATAQSAVSIISYKHIEKWKDDLAIAQAHNAGLQLKYAAKKSIYEARKKYNDEAQKENLTKDAKYTTERLAYEARAAAGDAGAGPPPRPRYNKLWKLPANGPKYGAEREIADKPSDPEANYVIGGRNESAPRVMARLFKQLKNACETTRRSAFGEYYELYAADGTAVNNKGASLRKHLDAMRALLYDRDQFLAKVFLEALLGSNPSPMTRTVAMRPATGDIEGQEVAFARQQYNVSCNDTAAQRGLLDRAKELEKELEELEKKLASLQLASLEAEQTRQTILQREEELRENQQDYKVEASKILTEGEYNAAIQALTDADYKKIQEQRTAGGAPVGASYEFLYERLNNDELKRTTVRMRLRIEITDTLGAAPTIVQLEAGELAGLVAHAVYSGHYQDYEDIKTAGREFVDCMFKMYEERSTYSSIKDAGSVAFKKLGSAAAKVIPGADPNKKGWWAAPWLNLKKLMYGPQFHFDPCELEIMVIEQMVQARLILPNWPQPEASSPSFPADTVTASAPPTDSATGGNVASTDAQFMKEIRIDVSDPGTPHTVAPTGADEDDALMTVLPSLPDAKAEEVRDLLYITDLQEVKEAYYQNRRDAALKALAEKGKSQDVDLEEDEKEEKKRALDNLVTDTRLVAYTSNDPVLVRVLPQVVRPNKQMAMRFQSMADINPPEVFMTTPRKTSWATAILGGLIVASVFAGIFAASTAAFLFVVSRLRDFISTGSDIKQIGGLAVNFVNAFQRVANAPLNAMNWFLGAAEAGQGVAGAVLAESVDKALIKLSFITDAITSARWGGSIAWKAARGTIALEKQKNELNFATGKVYMRARNAARGVPVASALDAARAALKRIAKQVSDRKGALRGMEDASSVFLTETGERFRFLQFYSPSDFARALVKSNPLYTAYEWKAVPYNTALTLLPPTDVTVAMYDAEELRSVKLTSAVEISTGASNGLTPKVPSDISAKAAYDELLAAVKLGRVPFQGEHLMGSAGQTAARLVGLAVKLLDASYSTRAGITLVKGDDALWSCFAGGIAARILVRHLSVFETADRQLRQTASSAALDISLQAWTRTQRGIVDAFLKALTSEASEGLKREREMMNGTMGRRVSLGPTLREMCKDATHSYERVRAMAGALWGIASLACASSAFALFSERTEEARTFVTQATTAARAMKDQADLNPPKIDQNRLVSDAAWASRRVDPPLQRTGIRSVATLDDITNQLSGLEVTDASRVYYCPMGSRLDSLPSNNPFGIDVLGRRLVWLSMFAEALDHVHHSKVADGALKDNTGVITTYFADDTQRTGYGRHPLAVVSKNDAVYVPLARHNSREQRSVVINDPDPGATLATAVGALSQDLVLANDIVQEHVEKMRIYAFNTERLLNGLALAIQMHRTIKRVRVQLKGYQDVVSLAIAITLLRGETAALVPDLEVELLEAQSVVAKPYLDTMNQARSVCLAAGKAGVKAATLTEVCLCML